MDLVSLETSTENELIKRRIVEGKVRSIILIVSPAMNGYLVNKRIMFLENDTL
jgi:hypothetical protein